MRGVTRAVKRYAVLVTQEVAAHTGRLLVTACCAMGQPMPEAAAALGLSPVVLADPEGTFPKRVMDEAWVRAIALSGDPLFGLGLSRRLRAGSLGAVEYMFRNTMTLGAAYDQAVRFQNLLQRNSSRWERQTLDEGARFVFTLTPPIADAHRHITEFALGCFVGLGRAVATRSFAPLSVSFAHSLAGPVARYEETFGVRPRFRAAGDEVVLARDTLAIEIKDADPHLLEIVERYAEARPRDDMSIPNQVRAFVRESMHLGTVTLERAAAHLRMSTRTLRRRLKEDDVTFQALCDEVRYDAARAYLQQARFGSAEIASLLGYQDVNTFYRSFQRWSGMTLSAFRARQP